MRLVLTAYWHLVAGLAWLLALPESLLIILLCQVWRDGAPLRLGNGAKP